MVIRMLLAGDHPLACGGIRAALEKAPDIEIVGEAQDGAEAQRLTAELRPDVVLLDLVMPGLQPRQIEEWVQANCPETATLILTAHDQDCYLAKALAAGVSGYLTKDEADERLVEAVRRAARGEVLVTREQLARADRWRAEVDRRWTSLTGREREVLELAAEGKTNAEIAQALCVSVRTVGNHIGSLLDKLGVGSRMRAVLWALREGFVEQKNE